MHPLLYLPTNFQIVALVAIGVTCAGMFFERRSQRAGRIAALSGATMALALWCSQPDPRATLLLTGLAVVALLVYRNWNWLWTLYIGASILFLQSGLHVDWRGLLLAGITQWVVGA